MAGFYDILNYLNRQTKLSTNMAKKTAKPFVVVLLGPPGSGKGTQGPLLAEKLDGTYLVAGDLIREIYKKGPIDTFHKDLIERYDRGIIQSDETMAKIFDMIIDRLSLTGIKKGLVLDAYPLSINQVPDFLKIVKKFKLSDPIVIYLDISDEEALKRLIRPRWACVDCKKKVSLPSADPQKFCQVCEGTLVKRSDDKPDVIKNRLAQYHERLTPVLDVFKGKGQLIRLNGEHDIKEVFKDIWIHLEPRL